MWAAAVPVAMGVMSYMSQQQTNQSNAAAARYATDQSMLDAQRNRDFQERMSSTAHQREVSDLKAAGLNPLLSGTGGAGASSPSGSTGNAQYAPAVDPIGPAISSAIEAKNLQLSMTKQAAEVDNLAASKALVEQQTKESAVRTKTAEKDIPKSDLMNRVYRWFNPVLGKLEEGAAAVSAQSKFDRDRKERARARALQNADKFFQMSKP